ncbi:MAG: polyphosphate polymerase domain-containing protein, partial [Paludibacter sp.]|nr:polyphosphate polymerase domain-containing protein [Paludibacter sp.]
MNDTLNILNTFDTISLEEMSRVKLLDRMDKKYMLHADQLSEMLLLLKNEYFVLEIAQKKFASYETTYFDTADYEMYTKHHNGKLNRYKVRFRTYADSNLNFFEVKFKTNKGRTKKSRVQLPDNKHCIEGDAEKLLLRKTNYTATMLSPVLEVKYSRITLVNSNMTERITIDFGLNYNHNNKLFDVPNLIIA